jgi:hypothetical protein
MAKATKLSAANFVTAVPKFIGGFVAMAALRIA